MQPRSQRQTPQQGKPGKSSPASLAFTPKASARRLHQRNRHSQNPKAKPSAHQSTDRGLAADFFGASPVASALGIRSGAIPRGRIHTNTPSKSHLAQYDVSTLPGIRHFYFALTGPVLSLGRDKHQTQRATQRVSRHYLG